MLPELESKQKTDNILIELLNDKVNNQLEHIRQIVEHVKNQDSVIEELKLTVKSLENKISTIENNYNDIKNVSEDKLKDDIDRERIDNSQEYTRVHARDYVIEILNKFTKDYKFSIANRKEGGGIIGIGNNNVLNIKFFFSNINKNSCTWNACVKSDLEKYEKYIFSFLINNEIKCIVLNKDEIRNLISKSDKGVDSKGRIHFSFRVSNYESRWKISDYKFNWLDFSDCLDDFNKIII